MARQRQVVQEAPQSNTLEITVGRVKKDMIWVLVSVVVAVASGLVIGSFFKF